MCLKRRYRGGCACTHLARYRTTTWLGGIRGFLRTKAGFQKVSFRMTLQVSEDWYYWLRYLPYQISYWLRYLRISTIDYWWKNIFDRLYWLRYLNHGRCDDPKWWHDPRIWDFNPPQKKRRKSRLLRKLKKSFTLWWTNIAMDYPHFQ